MQRYDDYPQWLADGDHEEAQVTPSPPPASETPSEQPETVSSEPTQPKRKKSRKPPKTLTQDDLDKGMRIVAETIPPEDLHRDDEEELRNQAVYPFVSRLRKELKIDHQDNLKPFFEEFFSKMPATLKNGEARNKSAYFSECVRVLQLVRTGSSQSEILTAANQAKQRIENQEYTEEAGEFLFLDDELPSLLTFLEELQLFRLQDFVAKGGSGLFFASYRTMAKFLGSDHPERAKRLTLTLREYEKYEEDQGSLREVVKGGNTVATKWSAPHVARDLFLERFGYSSWMDTPLLQTFAAAPQDARRTLDAGNRIPGFETAVDGTRKRKGCAVLFDLAWGDVDGTDVKGYAASSRIWTSNASG